jgi:hypothetical protein
MVANTRTAARAGGIRPLDEPLPVQVKVDVNDRPIAIGVLKSKRAGRNNAGERAFICRWRQVSEVADSWRIDDEWWRKTAISRIYYRAIMEDGRSITIFQDLATGSWYRQGS